MNSKEDEIALSDFELAIVERVAKERGITTNEAATQLMRESLAQRVRQHLGRQPARNYIKRVH